MLWTGTGSEKLCEIYISSLGLRGALFDTQQVN